MRISAVKANFNVIFSAQLCSEIPIAEWHTVKRLPLKVSATNILFLTSLPKLEENRR